MTVSNQQFYFRKSVPSRTSVSSRVETASQPTITPALLYPPRISDGGLEIIVEKSSAPNSLTDWTLDWKGATSTIKSNGLVITSADEDLVVKRRFKDGGGDK
jgi:hypothetical protein